MLAACATAPCFVLALSPAPVHAEDLQAHRQIVSHNDLDLSDEADVRRLDRRIRTAIQTVCGRSFKADPAGKNDIRRCRAEAAERIAAQRDMAVAQARQSVRTAAADRAN